LLNPLDNLANTDASRPSTLNTWPCQHVSHGMTDPPKNPGTAAVLSAILPGLGQFYNGEFWRGIFWLIVTPGLWIGTGGLLGWVCHVIAAITAYRRARRRNRIASAGR
jgi:TM2 domain-containing membrane protein YozV